MNKEEEVKISKKNRSFEEDVKILLDACQNVHFQRQTPDFYLDKMKRINKNHIQELLKEKDKLDIEFQQAHKKVNENRHLIIKRLNTIENVLCSSTVLNMFLMLKMGETVAEEKKEINAIKIKLIDSVGSNNSSIINDQVLSKASCVNQPDMKMEENETKENIDILRLRLHQHARNEQQRIAKINEASTETNRIRKQLQQTQDELNAVKKELDDRINIIQNHEQEKMEQINEASTATNTIHKQLQQTQDELKAVKKELEDRININRNHEQEKMEQINEASTATNTIHKQLQQTQDELKAVKKELEDRINIIQHHEQEKIAKMNEASTETFTIHKQLQQTQDELKAVKKELEDNINIIRHHAHHEQERILEINKLKSEAKMCQIQLIQTQDDLEAVSKEINRVTNTIQPSSENEQMAIVKPSETDIKNHLAGKKQDLEKVLKDLGNIENFFEPKALSQQEEIVLYLNKEDIDQLQNQVAASQEELEYVKKMLNFKENIIQENFQHEQKLMEQLNKAEKDIYTLQNQLALTQNELEDVKIELNDKVHSSQQKNQHEQKEKELGKEVEVNLLRNQLTGTQHELEEVRKELNNTVVTIQEKAQHEQKVMEELNTVKVNILQNQLTLTQQELIKVKVELSEVKNELSCRINTIQQKAKDDQQIMEELYKMEKEFHISRLTETQHELEETKKKFSIVDAQKIMIELNKSEEVKELQSQLAGAQNELETVRKELNSAVNSIQLNVEWEKKVAEIRFSEVRLMLMKKLGFADQNKQHFENYMLEKCSRGMMSDIRRLIEDKVQLVDENIKSTVNGSNIVEVTVNTKSTVSNILEVTENEVHLVISIASFLKIIPFSASVDFIYSFVAQIDNLVSRQHVEDLLKKFPTLFKEESVGAGSSDKNWSYLDLTPIITI